MATRNTRTADTQATTPSAQDTTVNNDRPQKRERGMNKIFLLGRIGREPEGKYTPDGTLVVTASLGVNTYPNSPTDWFNLIFWRNTGELALQLVEKGARVQIEGHVRVKPYIDARTNERKIAHQVEVVEFVIVDYPHGSTRPAPDLEGQQAAGSAKAESDLDEIADQLNDLPL
jgi:single-strand DNA-binding protein